MDSFLTHLDDLLVKIGRPLLVKKCKLGRYLMLLSLKINGISEEELIEFLKNADSE